jgi:hypothetical protein
VFLISVILSQMVGGKSNGPGVGGGAGVERVKRVDRATWNWVGRVEGVQRVESVREGVGSVRPVGSNRSVGFVERQRSALVSVPASLRRRGGLAKQIVANR